MTPPLRILLLEDDPIDAELVLATLAKAGIDCQAVRVETEAGFARELDSHNFDLIISDYSLPCFDGLSALNLSMEKCPEVPFLFVSASMGEELAVASLKNGATDYLLKQRLSRLAPAVRRAVAEAQERAARQRAERSSRDAESLCGAIFEQAAIGIAIVDLTGRIVRANRALQVIFGYSAGEVTEMQLADLTHPDDAGAGSANYGEVLGGGRASFTQEKRFVRHDGSVMWGRQLVSLIVEDGGGPRFSVNMIEDISESREFEQRLRLATNMKDHAETANRAKSVFLSTMSHEIRTPMNAILGYTQLLLRDRSLGDEAKANLRIIHRSGEHLLDIINDVLDMAKIEAGRMELSPLVFDLPNLLEDVEAMFRLRAAEKSLEFDVVFEGEQHRYIVADQAKFRQVLINLIGNAVKFTGRGGVTVRVSVERREDQRSWLAATVEDTGIGLTVQEQRMLFQPFAQSQSGLNLNQGGTGLGLAISRRLARLMGGEIKAQARPVGGMSFRFEVPVEPGSIASLPAKACRGRVLGLEAGRPAPRVLIADDAMENRDWLRKLLVSIGFSVREASDGEAAIRVWDEWRPELVLMDLRMPVIDGWEAIRTIRARPNGKTAVLIALTASPLESDCQGSLDQGADDCIPKPCREAELFSKIGMHLGINYVYDPETKAGGEAINACLLGPDELKKVPPALINQLLGATLKGNAGELNELILAVAGAGEAQSARGLQKLADNYEYDNLIQLLEEACHQ